MKITFQTTFEDLNEELIDVEVTGIFTPGRMAVRAGFERFVEPDDPAEFEIESVVEVSSGREIVEEDNPIAWEKLIDEGIERGEEDRFEGFPEE